jgi:hypothetical protein
MRGFVRRIDRRKSPVSRMGWEFLWGMARRGGGSVLGLEGGRMRRRRRNRGEGGIEEKEE